MSKVDKEKTPAIEPKKQPPEKLVKKEMKIGELKLSDIKTNEFYLIGFNCCKCERGLHFGKAKGLDIELMIDNYTNSINKLRCPECRDWVDYYLLIIEVQKNEQKQVRLDRKQNNGGKK